MDIAEVPNAKASESAIPVSRQPTRAKTSYNSKLSRVTSHDLSLTVRFETATLFNYRTPLWAVPEDRSSQLDLRIVYRLRRQNGAKSVSPKITVPAMFEIVAQTPTSGSRDTS